MGQTSRGSSRQRNRKCKMRTSFEHRSVLEMRCNEKHALRECTMEHEEQSSQRQNVPRKARWPRVPWGFNSPGSQFSCGRRLIPKACECNRSPLMGALVMWQPCLANLFIDNLLARTPDWGSVNMPFGILMQMCQLKSVTSCNLHCTVISWEVNQHALACAHDSWVVCSNKSFFRSTPMTLALGVEITSLKRIALVIMLAASVLTFPGCTEPLACLRESWMETRQLMWCFSVFLLSSLLPDLESFFLCHLEHILSVSSQESKL